MFCSVCIFNNSRRNILATDLALYFEKQKYVSNLLKNNEFNATISAHRDGVLSLMMTGADLCAVAKPWETQARTVEFLYNEFFEQVGHRLFLSGNSSFFPSVWLALFLFVFLC